MLPKEHSSFSILTVTFPSIYIFHTHKNENLFSHLLTDSSVMSLLSPRSFVLLSTTASPITDLGSVVLILRETSSDGLTLSLLQEILI